MTMQPLAALVVDDNYFNRDLCNLALRHVGYSVAEAEDGLQALEKLAQNPFDLLVLDLAMPQLDGEGVLQHLVNDPKMKLSIIVMTANPHMVTSEVMSRADFVMVKPIDVAAFAQLARRIQDGKQRPSA